MPPHYSISEIARLDGVDVKRCAEDLAGIFEHTDWVAARAARHRPFGTLLGLHRSLLQCVRDASRDEQLALIRAHPELAGREAAQGKLTAASSSEQGRLGLDRLSGEEFAQLADLNRRYRERFGFPCIVALKLHQNRQTVVAEFERRLGNDAETEISAALEQIGHIVRGRLAQKFQVADARLSTHVLDTLSGTPGVAIAFDLAIAEAGGWRQCVSGQTNAQGRTDRPLLSDIEMGVGRYRLQFRIGDYFRRIGAVAGDPAFLDVVPIEFGIADPAGHYHVPLLCTPWSYTTYRGS